jgi:uncharacterized SAM-binding protein YcdF (DUF218 family)
MQHVLPWLASALARPSLVLTLLALAGLVLLAAGRRGARWLLLVGILPQAALLVVPFDRWVAQPLEDWYPALAQPPARVDGIVVLGGAHRLAVSRDRQTPGLNSEGERLTEFMALARRYPEATLVYAGGAHAEGWGEADAARLLFASFGLAGRVRYEDRSSNTWENALFSRRMIDPRPGETWILVTSALHMPRAVAAFRAAGWTVLADPVAFRTPRTNAWLAGVNIAERLALLDIAAHEWVGLAEYRLRGHAVLSAAAVAR